jgi:hypothetical protein
MRFVVLAVGLACSSQAAFAASAPALVEGTWFGELRMPGGDLRIIFHLSANSDGSLKATADSPDQGAYGLEVESFAAAEGAVRIEVKHLGASFEGKQSQDGRKVEGRWRQSGESSPLTLKQTDKLPEPNRPQVPRKPYPYHEEDVTYVNAAAGLTFTATLTYPTSGGPFPAVALITGSGPQDRDESVFGHSPFLVLADYLTRRGIAVLRADDRGVGGSMGNLANASISDLAGDALSAVAYLKARPEVDPKRIGLLGHSEGTLVAPLAATRSEDVAFIALVGAIGVPYDRLLLEQQTLTLRAQGAQEDFIAKLHTSTEMFLTIVKQESDDAAATRRIRQVMEADLAAMSEEERKGLGDPKQATDEQLKQVTEMMLNPHFRSVLACDPAPALHLELPVLVVSGEKDVQCPPKQNLPAIEAALKASGNRRYTVKELPGLNHLLQTAKTGAPAEYAQVEETVAPAALKVVGDWILEVTKQ